MVKQESLYPECAHKRCVSKRIWWLVDPWACPRREEGENLTPNCQLRTDEPGHRPDILTYAIHRQRMLDIALVIW